MCWFCSFPQPWNLFHNHEICWVSGQLKWNVRCQLSSWWYYRLQIYCKKIPTPTFARHLQKGIVLLSLLLLSLPFLLYGEAKWDCPFTSVMLFTLWICKASLFSLLVGMASVSVVTDFALWVSETGRSWGANHMWTVGKAKIPTPSPYFLQQQCWLSIPHLPC